MSVEVITMLGVGVSILLAIGSVGGWMIHRMDIVSSRLESRLGSRIDRVESKLGSRIDRVESQLGSRIDRVQEELVEVKVAVARIEGPPRHLVTAR
ncbi:hypothetical protein [Microbacterium suwonense]|uniref:Response regulator n=1 Tax=Microbacterium suwonense TaxID=683047 RepID=A0ABM8FUC2_9MICO|nr:hypothetical protein [Microbacterium suwonense]BDZ39206.1 hypothetical protein GCM10025863_18200 [Microbacterium suwonense]